MKFLCFLWIGALWLMQSGLFINQYNVCLQSLLVSNVTFWIPKFRMYAII